MLPISQGQRKRLNAKCQPVRDWLRQSNASIWKKTNDASRPADWLHVLVPIGGGTIGVAIFTLIICFAYVAPDPNGSHGHPWPMVGWIALATLAVALVTTIASAVRAEGKNDAWKESVRVKLVWEREANDRFYRAAQLIEKALTAYEAYCDRYMVWYAAVDEGLQDPDEETAVKNIALLDHAAEVITQAADRFVRATELAAKQEEFVRAHPNTANPDSEALSVLLAELGRPIEAPEVPALPDPRLTLAVEKELAELAEELHGGAALQTKARS